MHLRLLIARFKLPFCPAVCESAVLPLSFMVLCFTCLQYEDSLIMKIFVFLFINSYASFYYLAFVAENFGDCPATGCMYSLAINLAVVFGSSLASSVFFQIAVPYASYQWQYYERKDVEHKITRPEQEYLLGVVSYAAYTVYPLCVTV